MFIRYCLAVLLLLCSKPIHYLLYIVINVISFYLIVVSLSWYFFRCALYRVVPSMLCVMNKICYTATPGFCRFSPHVVKMCHFGACGDTRRLQPPPPPPLRCVHKYPSRLVLCTRPRDLHSGSGFFPPGARPSACVPHCLGHVTCLLDSSRSSRISHPPHPS